MNIITNTWTSSQTNKYHKQMSIVTKKWASSQTNEHYHKQMSTALSNLAVLLPSGAYPLSCVSRLSGQTSLQ